MTTETSQRLAELDGLLRSHKVTITPAENRGGDEEVSLTSETGEEERFVITSTSLRNPVGMGTVTLYNTRTGERRPGIELNVIEREMAKNHTNMEYPDFLGRKLFTLDKNAVPEWVTPALPCYLNPKHTEWELYKMLGGGHTCKTLLLNEMEQEEHLRVKHQITFRNRELKHARDLEEEERAWRRFQMGQGAPAVAQVAPRVSRAVVPVTGRCNTCGTEITANSKLGLSSKMRSHMRTHQTK